MVYMSQEMYEEPTKDYYRLIGFQLNEIVAYYLRGVCLHQGEGNAPGLGGLREVGCLISGQPPLYEGWRLTRERAGQGRPALRQTHQPRTPTGALAFYARGTAFSDIERHGACSSGLQQGP